MKPLPVSKQISHDARELFLNSRTSEIFHSFINIPMNSFFYMSVCLSLQYTFLCQVKLNKKLYIIMYILCHSPQVLFHSNRRPEHTNKRCFPSWIHLQLKSPLFVQQPYFHLTEISSVFTFRTCLFHLSYGAGHLPTVCRSDKGVRLLHSRTKCNH